MTSKGTPCGRLLADARAAVGMSSTLVARLAGCSARAVLNVEQGSTKGRPELLARIAYVVKVDPGQLAERGRVDAARVLEMRLSGVATLEGRLRAKRAEFASVGAYVQWALETVGDLTPSAEDDANV